jgi:late competence protein required for DNA uptake (superfamily II DNA/RNA helicase)
MRERELERVMRDFYHRRFNLLVCTTIIESGIDVPSANTIVINRADRLGLAQPTVPPSAQSRDRPPPAGDVMFVERAAMTYLPRRVAATLT